MFACGLDSVVFEPAESVDKFGVSMTPKVSEFVSALIFVLTLALAFLGVGEIVGDGLGEGLAVTAAATAVPATISTGAETFTVFGGKQVVSLQTWKRTLASTVCVPGCAAESTTRGTVKEALPE